MVRKCDMQVEELKDMLREKGRRHRWYFHYTTWPVLEKMIVEKQLWLSSLERMNDGKEAQMSTAGETFAACFSYGSEESVAMWNTYGIPRQEVVRLCFDGKLLRKWLAAGATKIRYWAIDEKGASIKELPSENVKIDLQDIAYTSGKDGDVAYNDELITVVGKDGSPLKQNDKALYSFVKMGGWSYEREVRLVVTFPNGCKVPRQARVAVDFGSVIAGLEQKELVGGIAPITASPWPSPEKTAWIREKGLSMRESAFAGYLDNLKTICDKCDEAVKGECRCKHKNNR